MILCHILPEWRGWVNMNRDFSDEYTITLRNYFDVLRKISETLIPKDEYENFVNAHMEAEAECSLIKQRAKHRVPWKTLAGKKKCDNVKTASLCNKRNQTNANAQKHMKAQIDLSNTYLKEQTEYTQYQINKIRNTIEDRQSRIAWQIVNEVSKRKSTASAKLKAASKEERMHL